MNAPRAVVTGIGLVSPVGRGVSAVFDAVCECRSGLRRPPEDHPVASTVDVAGIAPDVERSEVMSSTRDALHLDRFVLLAMAAAKDALTDARLVVGRDVDPLRVAVVLGTGGGGLETYERQATARRERGRLGISPYFLPGMLPNMAAARIAIEYGIRGVSSTIATACAAGAQAVAESLRIIRAGEADVVVCGGSDAPLHPTVALGFANAQALAHGWDAPDTASRPFDRRRNGFVLAEGAGVLVVERADHAVARGVAGYADLVGWGGSTDAQHPTTPRADGQGAMECMRRALADAGLGAGDVDYINAHGTSTKLGDVAETLAVNTVFAGSAPAVSSTKGVTGHLLGGAGVLEAAVTAVAISRGVLPPTHNLTDPDPACDLNHVTGSAKHQGITTGMSNSFAFGGHNISLLFARSSSGERRHERQGSE